MLTGEYDGVKWFLNVHRDVIDVSGFMIDYSWTYGDEAGDGHCWLKGSNGEWLLTNSKVEVMWEL